MGQNVAIYPYIRKDRINKAGEAPILIRFDIDNKPVAYDNIEKKIKASEWDDNARRVKKDYPNAGYINSIIDNRINKHKKFVLKREALNLPLTKAILQAYAQTKAEFDFFGYAEHVLENKRLKDDLPYSDDTKRRYRDEIKRIEGYQTNLQFNDITVDWLENYRAWLRHEYIKKDGKHLEKNSIWKALSFVRMIYNEAVSKEIILPDSNPFKNFVVGSFETDLEKIKWLNIDEVDSLEKALLENHALPEMTVKVGWRFLAMCVSGLRISDGMRLDDYFFNSRGSLEFKPHKTRRHENIATIPISTARQKRYFERTLLYKFPDTDPKNFRTTFNNHLKVLAAAAGVRMDISSHVGRHTMGGLMVDAGIEMKPAKAMLGVKSNKTIETYMHLKESKLELEAQKMNGVM